MSKNETPVEAKRTGIDTQRIRKAVREILVAIGEDPERVGIAETPDRVAEMYEGIFAGMHREINEDI